MGFKRIRHFNISTETPESLYRDLRNRKIEGLLSHQADLLREYHKQALDKPDVALQLPTGSGKTLVGLLIGEWRRRVFKDKVVYLCPTRQLVNQVVEQSKHKYGISANAFVGPQKNYSSHSKAEYKNADAIAVTTYSGLFNTNSFFDDASLIILDDAHSAENYIAKYWSLSINKQEDKNLFDLLIKVFKDKLSSSDYQRLNSSFPEISGEQWVEKIPTPDLDEPLRSELTSLLDEYTRDSDLKYSWSILRDRLFCCHVYLSCNSILIRPVIPPTRTHKAFFQAKQRLYMSATLGEGGELERLSGVPKVFRLSVPEGWDKQGIGRRLFLFPGFSLNEEDSLILTIQIIQKMERTLFLVPNDKTASQLSNRLKKEIGSEIFDAKQIEQSKQNFISSNNVIALVANRYDGIDLSGDECRLLVINNLQRATNLQENFLVTRLAAGILLKDRILTRFVQAVGRCTRSATDYAAVIILGDEQWKIVGPENRKFLHPELQAEIEFGLENSKGVEESVFMENLEIFLEHGESWNTADEDIVSNRNSFSQEKLPALDKLMQSVPDEIRYQYALWNRDFEKAIDACRDVLSCLSGDDVRGYRAFWYYLAGSAAWMGVNNNISSLESVARDYFKRAADTAQEVPWLSRLARLSREESQNRNTARNLLEIIENLASKLEGLGTVNNNKFESQVKSILENLQQDSKDKKDSKKFEDAHVQLGQMLGYRAENSEIDAAPDPWWIAGDDLCIVFEDHSGGKGGSLGANKVRQAASHPNWIEENIQLDKEAKIIPVMVTPAETIENGASPHTKDVCYWHLDDFRYWAKQALLIVRELRRSFPGEANLEWRQLAMQKYKDAGLDPDSLVTKLQQKKLRDLPTK